MFFRGEFRHVTWVVLEFGEWLLKLLFKQKLMDHLTETEILHNAGRYTYRSNLGLLLQIDG